MPVAGPFFYAVTDWQNRTSKQSWRQTGMTPSERLLIDPACNGKLLGFLAEEKELTAITIFPDGVGLGRFLRWPFESLRAMLL